MKLIYFVHDLNDPAVQRRVRMFHAAGAEVSLLGFYRGQPPEEVDGTAPLALGRTADGQLRRRALAVLATALRSPRWRGLLRSANLIVARQIETLALAALARRLHTPATPMIFECLDIHSQMGAPGLAGHLLRAVERRLLAQCQGLVVSSPHFIRWHFEKVHARLPLVTVWENKALAFEFTTALSPERRLSARPLSPPWRIGWYGVIRCAVSLHVLADLARTHPGQVEIVIRGRVAKTVLSDFDAVVAATPGLSFGGPFDRARDLPALYGAVHFAWAIDFYEAGSNSDWLLPNRLYEAGLFGAVAIACRDVATGTWLAQHGIGVLLEGEPGQAIKGFIETLDRPRYDALQTAVATTPNSAFLYTQDDCRQSVAALLHPG